MLLRFASGAQGMSGAARWRQVKRTDFAFEFTERRPGLNGIRKTRTSLTFTPLGEPPRLIRRNGAGSDEVSRAASRIPGGHPEGYLEAFAQIYTDVAEQIAARIEERAPQPLSLLVPTVDDGVRGVRFIDAAVRSSQRKAGWVEV